MLIIALCLEIVLFVLFLASQRACLIILQLICGSLAHLNFSRGALPYVLKGTFAFYLKSNLFFHLNKFYEKKTLFNF